MNVIPVMSALLIMNVAGSANEIEIFQTNGKSPLAKDVEFKRIDFVPNGANPNHVVVCRSVVQAGTNIPSRLCRTLARWEEIAADSKSNVRHILRQIRADGSVNESSIAQ